MAAPPKDIPPAELWASIQEMPRPQKVVDFPRKNPETGEPIGQVRIQVLTQAELMSCAAAAERRTRRMLKEALDANIKSDERSAGYDDLYNNAKTLEVLFRAVRSLENVDSFFFPSTEAIAAKLTQDEVGALMRMYLIVQLELGPIVAHMDADEMEAWVKTLAEGGSSYPLALLSSEEQNALVMAMASRLHSFLTATSSPG